MLRILVTGSSGMLGKDIMAVLSRHMIVEVLGIDKRPHPNGIPGHHVTGDLTDIIFIDRIISDFKPDIIVHAAAIVDVDRCEENRTNADLLHEQATKALAAFRAGRTRLIYVSTDSVFDGEKGNYKESDVPRPINYYALSKRRGEIAALETNSFSLVLRTNLYGFHIPKANSLTQWAIDNLSHHHSIKGFSDVLFNPLYTKQLADIIEWQIFERNDRGILNAAADLIVSKFDFLKMLAAKFGFPTNLIMKASLDKASFKAARPKMTDLNTEKLWNLRGSIPSLEKGLQKFKEDYELFIIGGSHDKN